MWWGKAGYSSFLPESVDSKAAETMEVTGSRVAGGVVHSLEHEPVAAGLGTGASCQEVWEPHLKQHI